MRDFTKSLFSFSWAMSLFGVQQVANLIHPAKAKQAFDNVTDAAREEFDEMTKETFQVGDELQRRVVDMTMRVLDLDSLNPSGMMRRTFDMTRKAADAVGRSMRGAASGCSQRTGGSAQQGACWGAASRSGAESSGQTEPRQSRQTQPPHEQPRQSRGWGSMPG